MKGTHIFLNFLEESVLTFVCKPSPLKSLIPTNFFFSKIAEDFSPRPVNAKSPKCKQFEWPNKIDNKKVSQYCLTFSFRKLKFWLLSLILLCCPRFRASKKRVQAFFFSFPNARFCSMFLFVWLKNLFFFWTFP